MSIHMSQAFASRVFVFVCPCRIISNGARSVNVRFTIFAPSPPFDAVPGQSVPGPSLSRHEGRDEMTSNDGTLSRYACGTARIRE
jgi:hypothetical protein